jgi:LPXTG-motif cell wall-anchored protein
MTLRRTRTLVSGCSLVAVAALTAVLTAPQAAADRGPTGSAYALSVATTLLDKPLVRIDPRPTATYPRGGSDALARIGPDVAGLVTAHALTASSVLKGHTLTSSARIADVTVRNLLSASVITVDCAAGADGLTGRASVADLTVLGQRLDATVAGEFDVLGGVAKVRINEQIRRGGTLTVNAVHVIVGGPVGNVTSADIVLSQAKCTRAVGGTRPPATTTTPPASTSTAPPTTTRPGHPTSSRSEPVPPSRTQGIGKASNDEELAETGASGVVPIALAGLVLLAGGGTALFVTKRRRTPKQN